MKYTLLENTATKPATIDCKYFTPKEELIDVLIIAFFGKYPEGSLEHKHATYISKKVIAGVIDFNPDAVILDYRELEYSGGKAILDVFETISFLKDSENSKNDLSFPVMVLVSEKSKNGIVSLLLCPDKTNLPDWISEDIDTAISIAAKKGKYWLDH